MMPRRLSVIQALRSLLCLSSLLGVFPLDSQFNFSRTRYLYSSVIGMACMVGRVFNMIKILKRSIDSTFLWTSISSQIALSIAWLTFLIYSPRIEALKESITALNTISNIDVNFDYPWFCYSFLLVKFLRYIGFLIIIAFTWEVEYAPAVVLDMLYRGLIDLFPLQFAAINDLVRQIFVQDEKNLDLITLHNSDTILIRHYRLCKLVKEVNSSYAPQISMTFVVSFVFLPSFSYLLSRINMLTAFRMYFLFSEMILVMYGTFVIVWTCSSLRKQVNKFNERLYLLTRSYPDLLKNEKITLFLEYNPQVIPRFLTFKIDYPIILKLISTGISYVVILIQFRRQDDHESSKIPK